MHSLELFFVSELFKQLELKQIKKLKQKHHESNDCRFGFFGQYKPFEFTSPTSKLFWET